MAAFCFTIGAGSALGTAAGSSTYSDAARLLVQPATDGSALVLQRGPSRTRIHSTAGTIRDARLIRSDVTGLTAATWREKPDGRDDEVRYVSIRLDPGSGTNGGAAAGGAWSRPRELRTSLALRQQNYDPMSAEPSLHAGLEAEPDDAVFIVQFETMSLEPLRRRLRELGATVLQAIPHNAHVIRIDPDLVQTIRAEPFVRWIGPYEPSFRVQSQVLEASEPWSTRRLVLHTFEPGVEAKRRVADEVAALGGTVVHLTPDGYLLEAELNAIQLRELAHSDHVAWIEAWTPASEDMNVVRLSHDVNTIEFLGGYDGSGVSGEVLDSGLMQFHQDHDGVQFHGPADESSHGTSTYGIVFGNGSRDGDGDGLATGLLHAGTGWFADYNFLSNRYQHTGELLQPPINAVFQSNSWGNAQTEFYNARSAEIDDIIWTYDIAVFQSQSNTGDRRGRPQAWAKNIVSVGGINHFNTLDRSDDCWCGDASYGFALDGRVKPDLAHWNESIFTTTLGAPPGPYTNFGGTSAATPITAGLAGLFFEMWADNILGNDPVGLTVFDKRPHAATAKALLINTAAPYDFNGVGQDLGRERQGWGLVEPKNLFDRADRVKVVDETAVLEDLEFDSYLADVPGGEPDLRVTMVYADRAALPSAGIHRVNDLTLRVTSPSGTVYWGNHGLMTDNWSDPGGTADSINTVENVFVQTPEAGSWKIDVFADEIAMDQHVETLEPDSDYALVVTGADALDECRGSVAVPGAVTAEPGGPGTIELAWTGAGPGYEVLRGVGGCDGSLETIAELTAGETTFTDDGVSGTAVYAYVVRGVDGCASQDSACVEATTSGPCVEPPAFDGLDTAGAATGVDCGVSLRWNAATAYCGGPARYNVYRSELPGFTPAAANRVALCVDGTEFVDANGLGQDTRYHYVVRAEDPSADGAGPCGGVEEANSIARDSTPRELLHFDFETGMEGWIRSTGSPAASTGDFLAGDPIGTFNGTDPAQPEDDHTPNGTQCLYTAPNFEGSIGQSDVDSGVQIVSSPVFDASAFGSITIDLWRWHYVRDTGNLADYYELELTNGTISSTIERLQATSANSWSQVVFQNGLLPTTDSMQLIVRSSDGPDEGTIVETAIDDVIIRRSDTCATTSGVPGAVLGEAGLRVDRAGGGDLRLSWEPDCGAAVSFGLYAGDLDAGLSSLAPVPGRCDVQATTAIVPGEAGNRLFLVAPNDGTSEGTLGVDSSGARRVQPAGACYPRADPPDVCAP